MQEFWNNRRAAISSPESEAELPPKVARLNRCATEEEASEKETTEGPLIVVHPADQVNISVPFGFDEAAFGNEIA